LSAAGALYWGVGMASGLTACDRLFEWTAQRRYHIGMRRPDYQALVSKGVG